MEAGEQAAQQGVPGRAPPEAGGPPPPPGTPVGGSPAQADPDPGSSAPRKSRFANVYRNGAAKLGAKAWFGDVTINNKHYKTRCHQTEEEAARAVDR